VKFRRKSRDDEPEINLVPMIDILLVVLIFLMVTTTFVKPAALKVKLPGSENAKSQITDNNTVTIRVTADGLYALDGSNGAMALPELRNQLSARASKTPDARNKLTVLIEADRNTSHQNVVNALDTIAQVGLNRVSIITQKR
jgi:biopolymer transport protein ExbD